MKITRIEMWHVAAPMPAAFRPAWIPGFVQTENRFDLVRICTASGLEGWTACQAMAKERAGLGALLGPYLLGERADDLPTIRQRIRELGYLGWRVGWLEPALWDILGKAAGKPVYQLLGGEPGGTVGLYASTGEVRSGAYRVDEIAARVAEGFTAVKLRVHDWTLEEDVAQIRQAREGAGPDVELGVDANQAWRVAAIADAPKWDYDRALAFCKAAEDAAFSWVEEPLPMEAYDDLARLREATEVNITGGELNSQGVPEFGVMLAKGCYDKYQPDAVFTGGIVDTWRIIQMIHEAGGHYSPHTWTNGVGFAINLQLFLASPYRDEALLEFPLDPPGWVPAGRDGVLMEPWNHQGGRLAAPVLPGLGFEIDRMALRRYGRRAFVCTPVRVAVNAVRDRGVKAAKHLGAVRKARMANRSKALDGLLSGGETAVSLALKS